VSRVAISRLAYVYDGRECRGFVLSRGRAGFEAFDREERSLGLYPAAPAAANAVCAAAKNGRDAHAAAIPTNQSFAASSGKGEGGRLLPSTTQR
jgi:hypothetical protein